MANQFELAELTRARMSERRDHLAAHRDRLTIDADVHPTDPSLLPPEMASRMASDANYFHGKALNSDILIPKLDLAGVDMALCWQNPSTTQYSDDQLGNAEALTRSNESIGRLADRHPERIIPAGWTDPKALGVEAAIRLARYCVSDLAMSVVKMNPAQNAYPIDDPMVFAVVDAIVDIGAVPAFHFGADTEFTPTAGLVRVAERHPEHPVIAVHMGGGGAHFVEAEETYQTARQAGLDHPNIFFALSAKRDVHMESDLITYAAAGAPSCRNIAVASDAPYGDLVFQMAGFRALFDAMACGGYPDARLKASPDLFDAEMVQGFMGRNLADLVISAYTRILERDAA